MTTRTISYPRDGDDFPPHYFNNDVQESSAQSFACARKEILNVLGASIGSSAQPTLSYRLSGTDTFNWGDQSDWVEIKWILSLLEKPPYMQSLQSRSAQYSTLVDIVESQRPPSPHPLHPGTDLVLDLEEKARAGNLQEFASLVERIDWSTRGPDELAAAIDLALSRDRAELAVKLAQLGKRLFPHHERIQRAARVLAPPSVRVTRLPRAKGLAASRAWLREQASQYKGQWVAVREGRLLATAESLEALETIVGQGEDAASTIVTRVL
jgi:hypothetical protein